MASHNPAIAEHTQSPKWIKRLSLPVNTICGLALLATMGTLLILSPLTAALLPILLLPTVWLFWTWNASDSGPSADAETMAWLYLASGTIGMIAVTMLESMLSYGFAILLFGSDTKTYLAEWTVQNDDRAHYVDVYSTQHSDVRKQMVSSWQYLLFLVVTSYIAIAMVEEGVKYCSLMVVRRYRAVANEADYITYAMASALGFGTVEGVAFIYQACQSESGPIIALYVFQRVFLGTPGHAMTNCLLAINVIRRDLRGQHMSLWQVVRLPVFLHGTFDFGLFYITAVNGNIGWVHPENGISLVLVLALAIGMPLVTCFILRHKTRKYSIRL